MLKPFLDMLTTVLQGLFKGFKRMNNGRFFFLNLIMLVEWILRTFNWNVKI